MNQSTPWAVGLDIGDRRSDCCVFDPSCEVVQRSQVPTTDKGLTQFFSRLEPCRVALEVGTHSAWIERLLSSLGHEVYVANPRKLRAIWDNDKKNDRTDAELLGEIVQVKPSLLRPIRHRSQEARNDLKLVQTRDALIRERTALVNHVRGSAKTVGGRMPQCDADTFHKTQDSLPEDLKEILQPILKHIGDITALIKGYDKAINERASKDSAVPWVTQVPGIGDLIGLAFTALVEDPNRFPKTRRVGSYVGLRPRLDKSGETDKQLRITKAGNGLLRRLLMNSAQYMLSSRGPDSDLKRWGHKLAARGGRNAKKRAAVAVARKLAVLLLTLWKNQAVYDPLRQAKLRNEQDIAVNPASNRSTDGKEPANKPTL